MADPRALLAQLFDVAVKAADPYHALAPHMARLQPPKGRVVVIGVGKGSAQMASALEKLWREAGFGDLRGVVVTRYGYATTCEMIDVWEAAHPVPDKNSLIAADKLKEQLAGLTEDDLVIALICGGGSALLVSPAEGLTLDDKIALNQALLASGAPIHAMNAIRKQVSTIKGGKLAQMIAPARLVSFIVSDIPGDNPALVSSGPTVADHATLEEAYDAIEHYHIVLPARIEAFLARIRQRPSILLQKSESKNEVHIIASASRSLEAAKSYCLQHGIEATILSDAIEGEARDIALMHAAMAKEITLRNQPLSAPVVLLSGGETTVTFKGGLTGSGGRNSEFALSCALAIAGYGNITALVADTDGIDGASTSAGAFCDGHTVDKMRRLGLNPRAALSAHDSGHIFAQSGDAFTPGPTGTNVNDFRALVIE